MANISDFVRYLETQERPEFLPRQLDVMGLIRRLAITNPMTAARELPGKLAESRQMLENYEPGQQVSPELMNQFMNLVGGFAPMGIIQKAPQPFTVAHGTKEPFTEFKSGMGQTARDIYTVPESLAEDASLYGSTIIKATASPKKMIDFSDFDKLDEPTIKAIKKAAKDAGITDKFYTFDQFKDDLMSGQLYQVGGGPRNQNAFLAELFTKFDAVKMPDARVGGGVSQSVIFQNPQLLKVESINNVPVEDYVRQGLLD